MYLKRKLYALACIAAWAFMIKNAYVVFSNNISTLPSTAFDTTQALNMMYLSVPAWLILFIFWQISPAKDPFSGNEKMNRKQQKMIDAAMREQPPRF